MQLKSLEISGFKSFPDRVSLQFDEGITAVVGPNGSGKSNIADAVRWVLGEQSGKTLRSGKMEDVIFSGTQQRKAMGAASVVLCIDNSDRVLDVDNDEVQITRRLYRSGESEYRINGTSVRLRDINELFMDTGLGRDGYSIIGQGRIAEIVGAKNTQRREIFEEAAGISKYRYRKEQAERQLSQAQENLLRLRDILQELEGRVGPLQEQAKKAQEYLTLAERRRTLEISLWMQKIERSRDLLRDQEDKLILAQNDYETLQCALEEAETAIRQIYEDTMHCSIESEQLREEMERLAVEAAEHRQQRAVLENDIAHNEERIRQSEEAARSQQAVREQLEEQLAQNMACIAERETVLNGLSEKEAALQEEKMQGERKHAALLEKQNAEIQEKSALQKRIAEERLRRTASSAMLEQLQLNISGLDEESVRRQEEQADFKKQLRDAEDLLERISEQTVSQQNVRAGYEMKERGILRELEEMQKEQDALLARRNGYLQKARLMEEMEKNMDSFHESVKYVLSQQRSGNLRGIEGTVSQLITVEAPYATAVEVALGGALQNIIVTTETAAKLAIEALKRAHAGRATFMPVSVIRGRTLDETGLEKCEGFVAVASDLVQTQKQYGEIVRNLLGRIVIAHDMDSALQIARQFRSRFRIVTLDGQVINPGGSMTGGSLAKGAGLLSRAGEIAQLKQNASELEEEQKTKAKELGRIQAEQASVRAQISGIDAHIRTMSEEKIRCEAECKRLHMAIAEGIRRQREAQRHADEIKNKLQNLTEQSGSSDHVIRELTAMEEASAQTLSELEHDLQTAALRLAEKREEISALRLEQITVEKDIQAARQVGDQLREQLESRNLQAGDLQEQVSALRRQNEQLRSDADEKQRLAEQSTALREKHALRLEQLAQEKTALEQRTTQERQNERELNGKAQLQARELARIEERRNVIQTEYDSIVARLYDEYELTLTQAAEYRSNIGDTAKAERELNILKGKIKALGSINVAAIEEYREVNERYQFLRTQITDAERSKSELHRLIGEMTDEMCELFLSHFQKISENFSRIFEELFGGGNARLLLDAPENPLESGIEIYVQPPGKIIKNLAALSGGEQAFVAIAIYFAILKVHPSPFCLLDEIEAALDDVNVVKYAQYLRRLTGRTQFIAITHRRGTMEEADVLYGVTMQEEGVSRLLRMNISELESRLG